LTAPAPILVRPATAFDRGFVLDTARRLADFELPRWRRPETIVDTEVAGLATAFDTLGQTGAVLVAETPAGEPVGFVYLEELTDYFTGQAHGHVSMLATVKGAEGRGAGTALLAAAEDWARRERLPYLTLNVFGTNARARALYERVGYGVDTVKYRKVL
jgi:ribosomal protein S18 acetylase RimI-like enzyme